MVRQPTNAGNVPYSIIGESDDSQVFAGQDKNSTINGGLTPKGYSDAVANFANLPSGEGYEYQRLADFLALPESDERDSNLQDASSTSEQFITLYRFRHVPCNIHKSQSSSSSPLSTPTEQVVTFQNVKAFSNFDHTVAKDDVSQVLSLRGFPSPDWLKSIGAKYHVDPEYFRRHLDLTTSVDRFRTHSSPTLPSSSWHLIQLPIYAIGIQNSDNQDADVKDGESLRHQAMEELSAHHHRLRKAMSNNLIRYLCDSIVRKYYVFDERQFAVEQRVSILLQDMGSTYTMFIWIDSSDKATNPENKLWHPESAGKRLSSPQFVPVIRHRRNLGLKGHLMARAAFSTRHDRQNSEGPPQSAALLHLDYGKTLQRDIIASDAFYALSELFRFAAFSMSQVLNLINVKIDVTPREGSEAAVVRDLRYTAEVVYEIIQQIHEVQQSIQNTKNPRWPKAPTEVRQKPALTVAGLEADYRCLLQRAQMIHGRCSGAVGIMMNGMAIAESREAIVQAKRVGRLTFLAFIFVPLSFTTSFFGMNVKQLGDNRASIWLWFVVSIPILAIAMSLLYLEFWQGLGKLLSTMKVTKRSQSRSPSNVCDR